MKYINIRSVGIICFPSFLNHRQMVEKLGYSTDIVASAGFVYISHNGPQCIGESFSLGIKAHKEDTGMLLGQMSL